MPCRVTGQGHVVTDTFSLSLSQYGTFGESPVTYTGQHGLKQDLPGSTWPQAPCSQQREPWLTHYKTLPLTSGSTEVREHILAQKEIITSEK